MSGSAKLPRGILFEQRLGSAVHLDHFPPSAALRPYVTRYWLGRWDLRGQAPFDQPIIPHPCVNIEVVRGRPPIVSGVKSKTASIELRGHGTIFGVKFTPGGFRPLFGESVAGITDRSVALAKVFGGAQRWGAIATLAEPLGMVVAAERLLLAVVPARVDAGLRRVTRLHDRIARDRGIVRVQDVAALAKLSSRAVQSLFREYVGVGPKWVIAHYRLQEAADRIATERPSLAVLARQLGYADQPHFTRDFKRMVGMTPARYARRCDELASG